MKPTHISPKWRKVARAWLGNAQGRHCHWCKHIKTDEGIAWCGNKASPYADGDRIRTWDGAGCAKRCPVFALDPWYTSDENYDKTFKRSHP